MRRRNGGESTPAAPERLCRFIAGEWPEPEVFAAFAAWRAARLAWVAEHGSGSALGSTFDLLRGHRDVRLQLAQAGYTDPHDPFGGGAS